MTGHSCGWSGSLLFTWSWSPKCLAQCSRPRALLLHQLQLLLQFIWGPLLCASFHICCPFPGSAEISMVHSPIGQYTKTIFSRIPKPKLKSCPFCSLSFFSVAQPAAPSGAQCQAHSFLHESSPSGRASVPTGILAAVIPLPGATKALGKHCFSFGLMTPCKVLNLHTAQTQRLRGL